MTRPYVFSRPGPSSWAFLIVFGLFVLRPTAMPAQQRLTSDVATEASEAVFVHDDVERFVEAMKTVADGGDTAQVLQRDYLDRASPGLLMFIEKYDLTLDRLLTAIRRRPAVYGGIDELLASLQAEEESFRQVYADIQRILPEAVFPPTYFVVAGHRGIGSGSTEGPLISIEKETPTAIASGLPPTLVHEMIHMQQLAALGEEYFVIFSGAARTLLATSIREGVATFLSELITGGSEHKNLARDYLLANEPRLWAEFRSEMLGNEMGDWLYHTPTDPEQPQDVGYAMGSRIARAYYEAASDKQVAAGEIVAVSDYEGFLAKSGYGDRFEP